MTREMLDTKKQYYEATRKRDQQRSVAAPTASVDAGDGGGGDAGSTASFVSRAAEAQRAAAQSSAPRFVGGGFNVHAA